MKKPRFSIFVRFLLATLLPLLIILGIVLFAITHAINKSNVNTARERTSLAARQAAAQAESKFDQLGVLLDTSRFNLESVLENAPSDRNIPEDFVLSLVTTNKSVYCSWLIWLNKTGKGDALYGMSYLRTPAGISGRRAISRDILMYPSTSPWFGVTLRTGNPFTYTHTLYDFRGGKGFEHTGGISVPVMHNGELAAILGVDVQYGTMFNFLKQWEENHEQKVFLFSDADVILYAADESLINLPLKQVGFNAGDLDPIRAAVRDKKPRMFEAASPFTGKRSLYNIHPFRPKNADRPLFLMSEVSEDQLYREAKTVFQIIVATSLAGLLLIGVSVFLATRNIVKPIRRLTRNAEWIASGKLDVVMDDFGKRREPRHEVDQLEASLGKMLEEMSAAHELRLSAMESEYEMERLAQTSEAKDRFFANMSHEIRTPMNAILGMSELLLSEPLNRKQSKYAGDIKQAAESLLHIINDILDLSKLESGKFTLTNVHYDLRALLDNIDSLFSLLAREKGLEFSMGVARDVPDCLYGDDLRLKQVLLNVAGNAIKFTRAGSVRIDVSADAENVRFDVADTGIGIRPEELEQLFQPFKQLDSDRNREMEGSGLGLSISRNLLELMGGDMAVKSVYGKGSVFTVSVPIVPGDPARIVRRDEAARVMFTTDARVLVVDDSAVNLDVAAGLIRLFGVTCDIASSGREALGKLEHGDYDIVFMDHMMPGMDGVETTRRIRKMGGKHAERVIVALTANAVIGTREALIEAGMNDFLSKPIVKGALEKILAKWIPASKQAPDRQVSVRRHVTAIRSSHHTAAQDAGGEPEAPADADAILDRLRNVPGLDVERGLGQLAGMEDVYLAALGTVGESWGTLSDKLRSDLDSGDVKSFTIEIHGVKGGLASIGAQGLSDKAKRLEEMAKTGDVDGCHMELPAFLSEFRRFVRDVARGVAPGKDGDGGRKPGGVDELLTGISALRRCLRRGMKDECLLVLDDLGRFDFDAEALADLAEVRGFVERDGYSDAVHYLEARFGRHE